MTDYNVKNDEAVGSVKVGAQVSRTVPDKEKALLPMFATSEGEVSAPMV
jgi:hypothetical protein